MGDKRTWTVDTDFGVNGDGARFECDPCYNASEVCDALNKLTTDDLDAVRAAIVRGELRGAQLQNVADQLEVILGY